MGALPRLKIKDELHYRKGSTNESENCQHCTHLIKSGIPGADGLRCDIIGVRESVRYRVREDHRCDAQELDAANCWWIKDAISEPPDHTDDICPCGEPDCMRPANHFHEEGSDGSND